MEKRRVRRFEAFASTVFQISPYAGLQTNYFNNC